MPVESPARRKPHTGFGGRLAETEQPKGRHRAASRPYWAILEDDFDCLLVNARHVKNLPGRKTDVKDAEWLCQLLEAGLLSASFVPPKPIRRLRNFTRYRSAQVKERQREANRLHKALEDTGIKLDCVITDIWVSRRGELHELYPEVVDAREEEGGVPSRLMKTEAGMAGRKARQWWMFAGSPSGRLMRAGSRWMISRGRARCG